MKFNKGDLVIHARGTILPHKNLQGVVIRADLFKDTLCPMYRVFWYTIGRYQNLEESCLKPLDNPLTT